MQYGRSKSFNLPKQRPQVLVIGNGLCYGSSVAWHDLITGVAREGADPARYDNDEKTGFHLPNTVMTLATSIVEDSARHSRYVEILDRKAYAPNAKLQALLAMPFDAVLTTNYSYEAEAELYGKYPGLSRGGKLRYAASAVEEKDRRYLLHTFNRLKPGAPDVWHIHGELRCPSSIVLSHDEYARLIHDIIAHNRQRADDYRRYEQDLSFTSWVDYFLMGDVSILGLTMDFAEFDLWWLLGRRLREKGGCGKCVFYEPEKKGSYYKQAALRDAGVCVKTCGVNIDAGGSYEEFYQRAIDEIRAGFPRPAPGSDRIPGCPRPLFPARARL